MSNDLSFSGSCEHSLIASKVWLFKHLPNITYKKVYVLGSWYGNMGLILGLLGLDFKSIVNVETNEKYCKDNKKIYQLAGFDIPYRILHADCNKINYDDADLVINTSTNDIKTHEWLRNVPKGCTVAIQCRNEQPYAKSMDRPNDFEDFLKLYDLGKVIYKGKMNMRDADNPPYSRYMLIGTK